MYKKAITLQLDSDGFYSPVVDSGKCIQCGVCLQKCPVYHLKPYTQNRLFAYSACTKNKDIAFNSSSGGVFTTLANNILNDAGVIIGAVYSKDYRVVYGFSDSYFNCFGIEHMSVRESCIKCHFRENHCSDITLADFWGYKAAGISKNRYGMSLVVINSKKGKELFEQVSNQLNIGSLVIEKSDYAFRNYKNMQAMLKKRETFFSISERLGFEGAAKRMVRTIR